MNADTARLCANTAGVHHLNSVHGVYLRDDVRSFVRELLPLAALNSVTVLGAELVGRSYGGGVLKMEPREADVWPVLSAELVAEQASDLRGALPLVRDRLAVGALMDAVALVERALLAGVVDLSSIKVVLIGRGALYDRRATRSRSK